MAEHVGQLLDHKNVEAGRPVGVQDPTRSVVLPSSVSTSKEGAEAVRTPASGYDHAGEGGDRRNSRSPPSLFFAGVCGTQVFGLFENDSLEVNLSLFGQVPFSDGSSTNLPSFFESGRRRSLPGSSRRLLSFPIHPCSRDRLGLSFGTSFTGSRLFPLGCAPLLGFHEKFSMVMAHLRRQGLRLFAFLDGCLLVAKSEVLLLDLSRVLFSTTQDL